MEKRYTLTCTFYVSKLKCQSLLYITWWQLFLAGVQALKADTFHLHHLVLERNVSHGTLSSSTMSQQDLVVPIDEVDSSIFGNQGIHHASVLD